MDPGEVALIRKQLAGCRQRNSRQRRTHCPKGHPYDEENTVVRVKASGLCRECRTCINERARERYRKRTKA